MKGIVLGLLGAAIGAMLAYVGVWVWMWQYWALQGLFILNGVAYAYFAMEENTK